MVTLEDNSVMDPALCGWTPNPAEAQRLVQGHRYKTVMEFLEDNGLSRLLSHGVGPDIADTNEVLHYQTFRKLPNNGGKDPQCGPQKIGDCVSWGWTAPSDYGQALAIVIGGKPWEFQEGATEFMYAVSRVEVGGQKGSRQDGSVGAWAAEAARKYGWLSRKYLETKYGTGKGAYDPQRSKNWGADGAPDDIEPEAAKHSFKEVVKVTSFDEAVAMLRLGKCVPVCSDQGFTQTRDSDGFCRPSGSWMHCMAFTGFRLDKPGLLCSQSWGEQSPTGPRYKDQPLNTFFVDKRTCDRMLSQDDSYAPADFIGYEAKDILNYYAF